MTRKPVNAELDRLILALLDDEISAQGLDELQVLLVAEPSARRRYHELVRLHNLLEAEAEQTSKIGQSNVIPVDVLCQRYRVRRIKYSLMAAAAMLMIGLVSLYIISTPDVQATTKVEFSEYSKFKIKHAGAVAEADPMAMYVGSSLELEQGNVELNLESGVRAVIQAPASFAWVGENHVELSQGVAWFHVPPGAEGFKVSGAQLEVVDLGTEFGIVRSGAEVKLDQVHVLKGKVRVTSLRGQGAEKILLADMACEVLSDGGLREISIESAHFLTNLPPGLSYFHWPLENSSRPTVKGNDPDARFISTYSQNKAMTQPKLIKGVVGNALSFSRHGSGMDTNWPGIESNRPRTISCWIKCPPKVSHGAIIDWGIPLTNEAKWRIVLNPLAHDQSGVEGALRTSFGHGYVIGSTDLRDGQWHHIAVVYDGSNVGSEESILLYVDGKLEKISASKENTINTILDNPRSKPCSIGPEFDGAIDELRIHQGILPLEAIQRLSER